MKKYIVLSVNENPKYLYFLPLTVWAWRILGWEPIIFYTQKNKFTELIFEEHEQRMTGSTAEMRFATRYKTYQLDSVEGFKSETIAQVSRLYGACVASGMIMTGDIDMIPLSDYWQPKGHKITTYGRDLTDYHYPMCYVAMDSSNWYTIMSICSRDYNDEIRTILRHQSNEWILDQDILTERLLSFGVDKITHIDRGTDPRTGYPIGRVDRSHWTLNHDVFIDAHLPHDCLHNPQSFSKVMELLHKIWPNEDFTWFEQYTTEFKKLL